MNALRLYRALVVDTNDPEGAGRVRLRELRRARGKKPREGWVPVANYPIAGAFALRPPYASGDVVLYAAEGYPFKEAAVVCMRQRNSAAASLPLTLDTGNGNTLTIAADNGEVQLSTSAGQSVTLETNGTIAIQSSSQIKLQSTQLAISAASLQVDAGQSRISGVVQCETLIANSVVASSYTPGAGNIW